jgi:hypothetical protein
MLEAVRQHANDLLLDSTRTLAAPLGKATPQGTAHRVRVETGVACMPPVLARNEDPLSDQWGSKGPIADQGSMAAQELLP